ncbi:MAG: site-specific DNA-methyltransferase [Proteobacteria bacterium]|nr:site-specific DNA-methyltransferase [Pseudomonadota bacterium]
MELQYSNKKSEKKIYDQIDKCKLKSISGSKDSTSILIMGDNLRVMKYMIEEMGMEESIDLVYIDPPFATMNTFHLSAEKANTISRSNSDNIAYDDSLVGEEYLEFIRERLFLIKRLMSDISSIYFHIDYKIGHYVKIIMDEVFGKDCFINDITRIKCNPKNFNRKAYGNIKDMILFYSKKPGKQIWNDPRIPQTDEDVKRLFKKIDKNGRRYTTIPLHAPGETQNGPTGQEWRGMKPPKGRHWRCNPKELDELYAQGLIEWSKTGNPRKIIYADESNGNKIQDILEFKDLQNPSYPTEKNLDLLKLIVNASSNPDSIVFDCFCGSGTTLKAAQELGREWIGIDKSEEAIKIAMKRLTPAQKTFLTKGQDFEYLEAY